MDVAFAERLSRWVRGFAPDNLPHPEPRAAPTYLRCVPISAALDCGLGDGWDALTVELLADAVEINVTGPFPRSAAERDATRSVLLSWTLVDAPATTYAATSLHSSGDGWGLASLTLDTPGLHGNAAVELRNGKRRCLQFDANVGLPFGQRPLRRRALTGEDVVRNSLKPSLEGLGDIVAGIAPAERLRYLEASVRRHAEDSLRLSGWLIEIDALASDSPLLDQLNEAIAQPIEWLRKAHLESVADGAPPVRNDEGCCAVSFRLQPT